MDKFLYITLAATAVISAAILARYRKGLDINIAAAVVLAVIHTFLGVICVKVFAGMENLSDPMNAGMSLFGALFFLPMFHFAGAKAFRRDAGLVFDDFSICIMTALMCVRMNCIVSGCCLGRMINGTGMRWPTRQVEILFWAVLLIFAIVQKEHGYIKGSIYPLMLMLYGIFRFIIEFFREGNPVIGPFHLAHLWAAISFLIGSTVYFMFTENEKRPRGKTR